MSILPDHEIRRLAKEEGMITPFEEKLSTEGVISYGLSSYGYDARVGEEFKVFTNVNTSIVDPKNFKEDSFVTRHGDIIIPPNSFVLCATKETFKIPEDVLVVCVGKSTYARCGLVVNVTPLEPGWEGQVTIEISNTTPLPAKVYANEGICQFLFYRGESKCETPYNVRKGKYMGQKGVTLPRIKEERYKSPYNLPPGAVLLDGIPDLKGEFVRPKKDFKEGMDDFFDGLFKGRLPKEGETLEDLRSREVKPDPSIPRGFVLLDGSYPVKFDGKTRWVEPTLEERLETYERLVAHYKKIGREDLANQLSKPE